MRRAAKILGWTAGALIGALFLTLGALLVLGNTGPGRSFIAGMAAQLSGGKVAVRDIAGRFPDALRVGEIELSDADGVWGRIEGLALDWTPLRLLSGQLHVADLTVARVALARLPQSDGAAKESGGESDLPVAVILDRLEVERLDLAPAVAGMPASLRLQGAFRLESIAQGKGRLDVERLDAPGRYSLSGTVEPDTLAALVDISEPAGGLIGSMAKLPDLGALSVHGELTGPRNAQSLQLAVAAGALRLDGRGTIDLVAERVDLDLSGNAPRLSFGPALGWESVVLDARIHGSFTAPEAAGHLDIRALQAGEASAAALTAELRGSMGAATVTAELAGLRLPGPAPDLLAAAPLKLHAEAKLDQPSRPLTFSLSHPLIQASGQGNAAGSPAGTVTLELPALAPLAAMADIHVEGSAKFAARVAGEDAGHTFTLDGSVNVTGGDPPLAALIGNGATISVAGTQAGSDLAIDHARVEGKALTASVSGAMKAGVLDLDWKAALSDLSLLAPSLGGRIAAQGRLDGPQDDLSVQAHADAELAVPGFPPAPLSLSVQAKGLPGAPEGSIAARGRLAEAPLQLAATMRRDREGLLNVSVQRANWKSVNAQGAIILPSGSMLPRGSLSLKVGTFADLEPFLGTAASGRLDARLETVERAGAPGRARLNVEAHALEFAGTKVERLTLDGTVDRPERTDRTVSLRLAVDGVEASGVAGKLALRADGPPDRTALRLSATLGQPGKAAAQISATAMAQMSAQALRLDTLSANYQGQTLRLIAPARFRMAEGLSVDRLRLGMGKAMLDAAGSLSPKLDLRLALRNVTPELAKPFLPDLVAEGTIAMEAALRGSMAAPLGTVHVTGRGLRQSTGPGAAIPPARFDVIAELRGTSARLDATLAAANAARLKLDGDVPLRGDGPLGLHAGGQLDLSALNPFLAADGRVVSGRLTLDITAGGTMASPQLGGTAQLAGGELQDFIQGIHITHVAGLIEAQGGLLRLTKLTGRAGPGTVSADGTVDLFASGMPVDATMTARGARLPASDFIMAILDADLTMRGKAAERLDLAGQVKISRAEINIPEKLPGGVAVLDIRDKDQPEPVGTTVVIGLDLAVDAQRVFVRGHGLDAEIGGELKITGDSTEPEIVGGFDMRRGTLSLAGQTLRFTRGKVSFDGAGLSAKLNPTIDFVAEQTSGDITARLSVTGYADAPKIQLSSTPELPQDEVLAQLLFGRSVKQLSPIQIAEIAQALASLGGGGGGFNPLASVRKGLGLDVLSVGSGSDTTGPGAGATTGTTVEAGKYIAEGVYVGTEQGTAGTGNAKVQIDLTDHLKLETTVGTGSGGPATGATPRNHPGSTVGLTWQFEY